jgi:hypothetical protein
LFSFSGSTVLPPGGQLFKEFREVLMSFLSGILQIQSMFFFVRQSFLFWNQISYFKGHVYSSLIVEIKSKRCLFLKVFSWNSSFFGQRPNTLFNAVLWLSCILKTKMTRCKIKMSFFMVLCISFNLWSWVYLLMVCDEVTFCEFQETKRLKSKLEDSSRKIVFFFELLFYQHA